MSNWQRPSPVSPPSLLRQGFGAHGRGTVEEISSFGVPRRSPSAKAGGVHGGRGGFLPLTGFTLIELLVVTVIMGLVTGVIASCLAGGIRVWDSVCRHRSAEAGVDVALRLMEKDLMNSFQFYGISFSGGSRNVSFSGLVNPPLLTPPRRGTVEIPSSEGCPNDEVGVQIGTIKYFFDESGKVLFRKEWVYPDQEPSAEQSEKLVYNVEDMELHYSSLPCRRRASAMAGQGGKDKTNGHVDIVGTTAEAGWQESWNGSTNFPGAVRIELSVKNNGQLLRISRTILLPLDEI